VLAALVGCTQPTRSAATTSTTTLIPTSTAKPPATTVATTMPSPPTTIARRWLPLPARVAFFSDSLGYEARQHVSIELVRRLGTDTMFAYTGAPGAALCDYREGIVVAIASGKFDVVAIEFSGNGFTECAKGPGGEFMQNEALLSRYRADAETVATAR
jgi:hypothetical protein